MRVGAVVTCHCGAAATHLDADRGPLCRFHWVRAARAVERREAAEAAWQHGTLAGYAGHSRRGEPQCDACRAAHTQYRGYQRFRNGARNRPASCPRCASVFLVAHNCHMKGTP